MYSVEANHAHAELDPKIAWATGNACWQAPIAQLTFTSLIETIKYLH